MQRSVDLLDLSADTDADVLVNAITRQESMIKESHREPLRKLVKKLQSKLRAVSTKSFSLVKELRAHILPLTNCAFNKSGDKFITGSYDRTCKVFDTDTGEEIHTLEGHKNVVYAIAFNNPYGDKIITGSFDKTCKLWDANTGECYYTLRSHASEIVCLGFNPQSTVHRHRLDGQHREALGRRDGYGGALWRVIPRRSSLCASTPPGTRSSPAATTTPGYGTLERGDAFALEGHGAEVSSTVFNYAGDRVVSASIDRTCRLWDVGGGRCRVCLAGAQRRGAGRVLRRVGPKGRGASADAAARVYDASSGELAHVLEGHDGEISKVAFNPQGTRVMTASSDKTCKIWDSATGLCAQTLEGHTDEIFSCAFNYEGSYVITGSKDNTCRIWKA